MIDLDTSPARMAERLRSGEVKITISTQVEPRDQAAVQAWIDSVRNALVKEYERQADETIDEVGD